MGDLKLLIGVPKTERNVRPRKIRRSSMKAATIEASDWDRPSYKRQAPIRLGLESVSFSHVSNETFLDLRISGSYSPFQILKAHAKAEKSIHFLSSVTSVTEVRARKFLGSNEAPFLPCEPVRGVRVARFFEIRGWMPLHHMITCTDGRIAALAKGRSSREQ